MKIQSTKTIEQGPVRIVCYAQQGFGKTSLAKTLKGKTLVLSLEKGLLSLKGTAIDYIDLTVKDDGTNYATATDKFMAACAAIKSPEIQKYDNVVLDSMTQFGYLMKSWLEETEKEAIEKNKFHLWGRIGEVTIALVNLINETMKPNFIMLMQESLDKDDENKMFYAPDYPGSASMNAIVGLFDEVYRLVVNQDGTRSLLTQPGTRHKAKSRGANTGAVKPVEAPDLGAIIERIKAPIVKAEKNEKGQ